MIWHRLPPHLQRPGKWGFGFLLILGLAALVYARLAFLCHDALERGERAAKDGDVPLSIAWFGKAAAFSLPGVPWDEEAAENLAELARGQDVSPEHARMSALVLAAAQKKAPAGMTILGPRRPWLAVAGALLFLLFLASMGGLMFSGFTNQMELRPGPARFWGMLAVVSFALWAVAVHAA